MRLEDQLRTKELVVFLGTGGVGKTTVTAAAALEAARHRRTLVLTIDPARRLADSLGVKIGAEPSEVRPNLDAMMLDTKAALDSLIQRYAPSPETMKRIFESRFYTQLSDAFAGSEEFVAMGTLHDLYTDGDYDVILVDTPPSKHAVDFLAVNSKLIRVFDSGLVKYLFKPTRFLRLGGGYMANVLAKWTSAEYLEEVAEFMMTFDQMFGDMEERVRRMQDLLYDRERTSINLVTSAERESAPMTRALYNEVTKDLRLGIGTCVVNRYYPRLRGIEAVQDLSAEGEFRQGGIQLLAEATGGKEATARTFLDDAVKAASFYEGIAKDHESNIRLLQKDLDAPFQFVPALPQSVHDMGTLETIRKHLFDTGT